MPYPLKPESDAAIVAAGNAARGLKIANPIDGVVKGIDGIGLSQYQLLVTHVPAESLGNTATKAAAFLSTADAGRHHLLDAGDHLLPSSERATGIAVDSYHHVTL
ncbi:hypothetical protein [Vibrio vulnificus]|uniref:hypothetical protein n=1 Tax=Vibrio vulnificus TaxID=672 RepID=UPI001FAFDDBC|nr:hypothetical protein [Vibrio vulnificus]MCJ0814910.1 hypothetical protein [Vibrio vulnificus]